MDFVPFHKIDSAQWDDFCLHSDDAWFRHTSFAMRFCLGLNSSNENLSFGVFEGSKLVAIAPLIKQPIAEGNNSFEFAMGGDPVPFPAFQNGLSNSQSAKLSKLIFEKIDELAKANNVIYSRFFIDPLSTGFLGDFQKISPFLKLGYNAISLTTNILDLSLPEKEMFKNIRDSYQYDIRSAIELDLAVDFFDKSNVSDEIFKTYKDIYFSAAGKEVGTPERWNVTRELIKQGQAVLALEKNKEGKFISGVIAFTYKNNAYYALGATIPDFKEINGISHLLQWEIIKYLKARNFNHYDLGRNVYPIISDEVYTPKELSISFFKSGFGGEIYPLIRGEKFYSADYLIKRRSNLSQKFIENIKINLCVTNF